MNLINISIIISIYLISIAVTVWNEIYKKPDIYKKTDTGKKNKKNVSNTTINKISKNKLVTHSI